LRDDPGRYLLKRVALVLFYTNRLPQRLWERWRGRSTYGLAGTCQRCALCCERPTLRLNALFWHVRWLRQALLAWQAHVNRFHLVETQRAARLLVFRCAHFDERTRRCDSYASRPGMCRDYPRGLLQQALPEFLPGCGYRPVLRRAASMRRALERQGLSPEQRERLTRELLLDE
jgi:hypothetical protein